MSSKAKRILSVVSTVLIMAVLFAGCMPAATGTTGTGTGEATTGSMLMSLLPILLLFVVFYFFMIRPEKKRKKKTEEMRNSLGVGDDIVTIGGLKGKIVHVTDDSITFETGEDRVRIEVAKWAISRKDK